jgi:hypothetical protein
MLVAGDLGEALDERGQGALALVVVDDEVLSGERQIPRSRVRVIASTSVAIMNS